LLAVQVHGADVQDRDGGKVVLKRSRARYPFVQRAYADGGYAGRLVAWAKKKTHIVLEIVLRNPNAKGFEVLPRRWVVERTFAWIMKNRRFARDYEQLTAVAETLITIAASATLIRRWP
jgi:transposase